MKARKLWSVAFVLAAAASATTATHPAKADSLECSVESVALTAWNDLMIHCTAGDYYAVSSGGECFNVNLDTIKGWLSMAQAAFLSGKKLWLDHEDWGPPQCQTTITFMRLQ